MGGREKDTQRLKAPARTPTNIQMIKLPIGWADGVDRGLIIWMLVGLFMAHRTAKELPTQMSGLDMSSFQMLHSNVDMKLT